MCPFPLLKNVSNIYLDIQFLRQSNRQKWLLISVTISLYSNRRIQLWPEDLSAMEGTGGPVTLTRRATTWQQWNSDSCKWPLLHLQPSVFPCQLQHQWRRRWHHLKALGPPEPHCAALVPQVWERWCQQDVCANPALCPHCLPKDSEQQPRWWGELVFCGVYGRCVQPEQRGQTANSDGGEDAAHAGGRARQDFLWGVCFVRTGVWRQQATVWMLMTKKATKLHCSATWKPSAAECKTPTEEFTLHKTVGATLNDCISKSLKVCKWTDLS